MKTKQLLHDIAEKCSKQKHVGDRVLQYRSKACKPGIYKNITSRPLALDSHNLTLKPFNIKTMLKRSMDRNDLQNSCTLGSGSALRPPKVIFISSFLHFLSSISYPFYPSTVSATTLGPQLRFLTTKRSMEKSASASLKICVVKMLPGIFRTNECQSVKGPHSFKPVWHPNAHQRRRWFIFECSRFQELN